MESSTHQLVCLVRAPVGVGVEPGVGLLGGGGQAHCWVLKDQPLGGVLGGVFCWGCRLGLGFCVLSSLVLSRVGGGGGW